MSHTGQSIFELLLGLPDLANTREPRNRRLIISSVPTSASYVSPPGDSFLAQFQCKMQSSSLHRIVYTDINSQTMGALIMLTISVFWRVSYFEICSFSLLKAPKALKFREWMHGEAAINKYCHDLALRGGELLKNKFGTELLDPTGELTWNMVTSLLCKSKETRQLSRWVLGQCQATVLRTVIIGGLSCVH